MRILESSAISINEIDGVVIVKFTNASCLYYQENFKWRVFNRSDWQIQSDLQARLKFWSREILKERIWKEILLNEMNWKMFHLL